MGTNAIFDYIDQVQRDKIPTLGDIVWYSVTDSCLIAYQDLVDLMTAEGLDGFLPKEPRDDDAFLRATSGVERKREPIPGHADRFQNFLVRKVKQDKTGITKQIVVETVDTRNVRLDYEAEVELTFNPSNGVAAWHQLGIGWNQRANELAEDAIHRYHATRNMVGADAVRSLINRVILGCNATQVKETGGVYFVTTAHTARLHSLISVIRHISGANVHPVPLIAERSQLEMVRKAYEDETSGEMDRLLTEMKDLVAGDPVSTAKFTSLNERCLAVLGKVDEYSDMLQIKSEITDLRVDGINELRRQLLTHTKR